MLNITDKEVLEKIIELQSIIIDGKRFKNILQENKDFFLNKSKADIITIYMHQNKHVKPEYILTHDKNFATVLYKYIFDKQNFKWEKFVENCRSYFTAGASYEKVSDLYQVFKGFMSKRDSKLFTKESGIKYAIIMPVRTFREKIVIGYICFAYKTDSDVAMQDVSNIKQLLRTLLRPLYDENYHKMYSKCIKIDEQMNRLTEQEKRIIKKVFDGHTYTEIAAIFNISINTVKRHIVNIFNKYSVNSKMELFNKFYMQINQ